MFRASDVYLTSRPNAGGSGPSKGATARPLLRGWLILHLGGGGCQRPKKKGLCT